MLSFIFGSHPKILNKLENGGLLVSFKEGKTRVFEWNLRYPFTQEIKDLTKKAYEFLPIEMQKEFQIDKRKRP